MRWTKEELWHRFKQFYFHFPEIDLGMDLSRVDIEQRAIDALQPNLVGALDFMKELEAGAIANPDENRMVGHYWLRNPALAPTPEIRNAIEETLRAILDFSSQVHSERVKGSGGPFTNILLIGIGGSALGPQFVSHALGQPGKDRMRLFSFDNRSVADAFSTAVIAALLERDAKAFDALPATGG